MSLPFSIDSQTAKAADVLNALLARCRACPVDIATAYFFISGYKLLNDLHHTGAKRLLLGSEPASGDDLGARAGKVQVRLFQDGFLHAKVPIPSGPRIAGQL